MNIIIITKISLYNVASIDTIIHLDLGDITFLAGRYTLITHIMILLISVFDKSHMCLDEKHIE